MRVVTSKELSTFKILPFDLYNEAGHKILPAGEVLTPGKLIMLKNYLKLYTEEFDNEATKSERNSSSRTSVKKLSNFSFDSLDANDFETVINREGTLKMEIQTKIKYFYRKTLDLFLQGYFEEGLMKLHSLIGIIISDYFKQLYKSKKGSQVRFLGEYELCHPLNVAIISAIIAKKLDYPDLDLEEVLLAGLLHDIGKLKIKLTERSALLTTNEDEVAEHTTIGYDIIREKLKLSDKIAQVALEHHENNDGSGYPKGLSNDYISELSQIVNVANFYDNLACNRTTTHISSNKDALRTMLEVGTKRFSAKVLYTFVHMYNYDDQKEFNDMII